MGGLTITGTKRLDRHIKQLSNPETLLDSTFAKVSRQSLRRLIIATPKSKFGGGDTRRQWQNPRKLGNSEYLISNTKATQDRKHSIIRILNDGRGVVRPVKAKRLYIPLTNKGRSKALGAPIPDGLIRGEDFVLAKQAKAFKGIKLLDKEEKIVQRDLTKQIIKKIRETIKR